MNRIALGNFTISVYNHIMKIPVYILAGGKSSRFGSDKALAQIAGEALLTRLIKHVSPISTQTTVIADSADKYTQLDVDVVADVIPDCGPIGGLLTALEHVKSPQFLMLTCDMTEFNPHWYTLLNAAIGHTKACVFQGDRRHPFPGIYSSSMLHLVRDYIAAGDLAMQQLLNAIGTTTINLPQDWPPIPQVNRQEDLKKYIRNL